MNLTHQLNSKLNGALLKDSWQRGSGPSIALLAASVEHAPHSTSGTRFSSASRMAGLLKVAVENARVQDKQIQAEKRELKMELYREREMRETLERQLNSELQSRASIQKRLKKEKKAKRRLQEALEFESKRRERVEDAMKLSSSSPEPEPLHGNSNHSNSNNNIHSSSNNHSINNHSNDSAGNEEKPELNGNQRDNAAQESRSFLKSGLMF
ncbi:unnamed protein product [Boreogadus saida]